MPLLKKFLIVGTAVVVVLGAGLGFFWPFGQSDMLRLHGMVEIQEIRLGSKVSGRVGRVHVREGEHVRAGTPLVEFEIPELKATADQLQAKYEQAKADYARIKNGARAEEKQAARAAADAARARLDKLIAGWREEEKKEAAGELDAARADLEQTNKELTRVRELLKQKSSSQGDVDSAQGARDRAGGRTRALEARYQMLMSGSRKEEIAEARAEYERTKAQTELLEAGSRWEDIAVAQAREMEAKANLDEIKARLREAVVVAPDNVLVEVVAVRKGDIIPPNQPVLRVLRDDDLWVKVFVPEPLLGRVPLGQEVDVYTDSFPDTALKGTVVFIDPVSEFTPRNVQSADERRHQVFGIKVRVDNPQNVLKAGMAAEVRIPLLKSP